MDQSEGTQACDPLRVIVNLVQELPNLKLLMLERCEFSQKTVGRIQSIQDPAKKATQKEVYKLKRLRMLSVNGCSMLNDSGLSMFSKSLPSLEALKAQELPQVTGSVMARPNGHRSLLEVVLIAYGGSC